MGKRLKHKKTPHTIEQRGQPVPSRWSKGFKEQKRQTLNINNKKGQKGSTVFERSVKIQEGLNMFNDTKPHAHLQNFTKTHAKFHEIRVKLQEELRSQDTQCLYALVEVESSKQKLIC